MFFISKEKNQGCLEGKKFGLRVHAQRLSADLKYYLDNKK